MNVWDWNAAEWLARRIRGRWPNRRRRPGAFGRVARATAATVLALVTGVVAAVLWGTLVGLLSAPAGVIFGLFAFVAAASGSWQPFRDMLE